MTRGWSERWLGWLSPLLLVVLWEGAARAGWLNEHFFPAPSAIAGAFAALAQAGTLTTHVTATLGRLLLGFLAGALPAVLLGMVLGLSRPLRLIVLPIANVLYTIPKIAILPLVLLVLGLGEASKITITGISVFFLVLLNTVAGVLGIERAHLDVARNLGASRWQIYRTIALPGALPLILTGGKLGMGFALIVVVSTEFVVSGARTGVGVLLWESWQVLNIEAMYVGLVLTALLGWALNLALDEIELALVPWRRGGRAVRGQGSGVRGQGVSAAGGFPHPNPLPEGEGRRGFPFPGSLPEGGSEGSGHIQPGERPPVLPLPLGEGRGEGIPPARRWRAWLRAARPFSFTASVVPVALGAALAATAGAFDAGLFGLTLLGSVLIHAGANMANDYYDHRMGVDTPDSLGPSGVIQRGLLTPAELLRGTAVCFGLGIAIGLFLVAVSGPAILWIGLVSVPLAFFYTGKPFHLGYKGLGELIVLIFMGPVMVLGSYFVQARRFELTPLLLSLPVAFLVAAILHANNLRDLEGDKASGKQTLATLLGRERAVWEYYILVFGGYAVVLTLALLRLAPPATLLPLLTLPTAISLARVVATTVEAGALNRVLRKTAGLHLRFGALLIAGVLLPLLARWAGLG